MPAGFTVLELRLDPGIRFTKSFMEWHGGFPVEHFLYKGIIAVPSGHTARRIQIVFTLQFDATDLLHQVHKFING